MEKLKIYDPEWFIATERRFETSPNPKSNSGTPKHTWKHETEQGGGGVEKEEPVLEEPGKEDLVVSKITSWLKTISLENGSQDVKDIHS